MADDFTVPDDWYRHFFTAPVNLFWEKMVDGEATRADVAFLRRHIAPPPARLLDIPCGAGRHALALADAGYDVTGVDQSEDAIARARARVGDRTVRFERADMRFLDARETFDAVLCLGNSLAYFPPEETVAFLVRLGASAVRGGRLILDTYCCAESIFPLREEREIAFEGGTYRSEYRYDPRRSVLKTKATLTLPAETHELRYAHHIVTTGALVGLVEAAGIRVDKLFADADNAPFLAGSPRLLLVGTCL
jgi:SAM-dependent methyltransferase